jgi:hypothetical protein
MMHSDVVWSAQFSADGQWGDGLWGEWGEDKGSLGRLTSSAGVGENLARGFNPEGKAGRLTYGR